MSNNNRINGRKLVFHVEYHIWYIYSENTELRLKEEQKLSKNMQFSDDIYVAEKVR